MMLKYILEVAVLPLRQELSILMWSVLADVQFTNPS
jgi:hypothetical protein